MTIVSPTPGVTVKPVAAATLKRFDSVRYAPPERLTGQPEDRHKHHGKRRLRKRPSHTGRILTRRIDRIFEN
jgi:hypothetical protein